MGNTPERTNLATGAEAKAADHHAEFFSLDALFNLNYARKSLSRPIAWSA